MNKKKLFVQSFYEPLKKSEDEFHNLFLIIIQFADREFLFCRNWNKTIAINDQLQYLLLDKFLLSVSDTRNCDLAVRIAILVIIVEHKNCETFESRPS